MDSRVATTSVGTGRQFPRLGTGMQSPPCDRRGRFHSYNTCPAMNALFVREDRETGKLAQKPRLFIAKFHYTDPTRTKSAHVVEYELNSTTRTRPDPHGPNGVSPQKSPCRVRVGSV